LCAPINAHHCVSALMIAPAGCDAISRRVKRHTAGTTRSVNTVEASNPEMIAQAIGGHSVEDENASGSKPATVVAVVSRIGRVRRTTAPETAASTLPP